MNKKLLLTSAAASAVAAPGAFGELLTSDVFQELFSENHVFIDLDANSFSTGSTISSDIEVSGASGSGDPNWHGKARLGIVNGSSAGLFLEGNTFKRFGFGETLTGTTTANIYTTETNTGSGNWGGFTGIAYVGLERNGNLGWIELDYNPGTGGAGSIVLNSFGFANEGETITAGQIPEPATTAGVMALLAGSAVLYARRRKSV